MKCRRRLSSKQFALAAAITLSMFGTTAQAQTTWTNTTADGLWSTPGNWNTALEPTAADNVLLPLGLPGTITLATGEVANALTIEDAYTLTGGALTLTTGGINVASGATGIISTVLNGSAGLIKTGTGTLQLTVDNGYTGGTTITGGKLIITSDLQLGPAPGSSTTNITINGGTLQLNTGFTVNINRRISIGASGATFNVNSSGNNNYAGIIQDVAPGAGALFITGTGSGIYVPQGLNTYSGGTHLGLGTTTVQNTSSVGSATTGDLVSGPFGTGTLFFDGGRIRATTGTTNTIGNAVQFTADTTFIAGSDKVLTFTGPATLIGNRTLTTNHVGNILFNGVIGDGGSGNSLTIGATSTAASRIVLNGANSYTGSTIISGGTLQIGNGGTTGSLSPSSNIVNNSALIFNRTNNVTQGVDFGTISGSGTLTQASTGTLALMNTNTHTGDNLITAGNVAVGNNSAFGTGLVNFNSTNGIILAADPTARTLANPLTLSKSTTFGSVDTGNLTFTGDMNLGTSVKTITVLNAQTEFSGIVSGVAGGVLKTGAGTLVLSGANSYTGATTVNVGMLIVRGTNASTAATTISSSALSTATLSLAGTNGSLLTSPSFVVTNAGAAATLNLHNTAAGNNSDRLLDTATIALTSGSLSFTNDGSAANFSETVGPVTYAGGANHITAGQAAAGQTSTLTLTSLTRTAGTLNFNGVELGLNNRNRIFITPQAAGNFPGTTTINNSDYAAYSTTDGVVTATYTDIDALGSSIPNTSTVNARIQGPGSGANTTLAATTTTINTLLQNSTAAATINTASQNLRLSGIMIPAGKQALTIGAAVDSGTLTGTASNGLITLINHSTNPLTINSVITNNGTTPLQISGTGSVFLTGTNTYTGATVVTNSNVTWSGNRTVAGGSITIGTEPGATATGNLTGGALPLGGGELRLSSGIGTNAGFNQSGGTLSFTGGNAVLVGTVSGSATYNFTGGTISTSATNVARGVMLGVNTNSAGVFNMSGSTTLNMPTAALLIGRFDSAANNTTTAYNQSGGAATFGNLSIGGNGTTTTGGTAALNITGGTFSATSFDRLGAGNTNAASILIGGTALVTLPAFPTTRGSGASVNLRFDGGTLIPAAASSTYLQGLTGAEISANGANFQVPTGNDITVAQGFIDAKNQNGILTKLGPGKLTLTGVNTYSGNTTVSAGTLALDTTGSIAASPLINVAALATFDVATVTGGFTLGTAQTLAGNGTVAGNVTLAAGANLSPGASPGTLTFTGNLNISATGGSNSGDLFFELGTSSDLISLTSGALTIGTNLGFNDFAFTAGTGFGAGTYTLFNSSTPIGGTLDGADLSGLIGAGFTGTLGLADGGNDIVLNVTAIPEPSTLVLAGLGMLGFAGLRLRRHRLDR